jgi:hypothetical protein
VIEKCNMFLNNCQVGIDFLIEVYLECYNIFIQ